MSFNRRFQGVAVQSLLKNIIWICIIAILVLVPSLSLPGLYNIRNGQVIFFSSFITIIFFFCILMICSQKKIALEITRIDILLCIAVLYIALDRFLSPLPSAFSLRFIELIGLSAFYIILRQYRVNYIIFFYACVLGGAVQAIYGLLQLYGIYPSNNSYFPLTGNFSNPGPYAGYILSGLSISIALYIYKDDLRILKIFRGKVPEKTGMQIKMFFLVISLSLMAISITACKSRASWFAIFVGGLFLVYHKLKPIFFKRVAKFKWLIVSLAVTMTLAILFLLYDINKDSANGRVLVWGTSRELLSKHLYTGIGFDRFSVDLMGRQARYFENHALSAYSNVAGEIRYPFNLLLLYLSEMGIFFTILVLFFCYRIFSSGSGTLAIIAKFTLLAQIVFAFFSYSEQVLAIKINIVCIVAFLAAQDNRISEARLGKHTWQAMKYIFISACIVISFFSLRYLKKLHSAFTDWDTAFQLYSGKQYMDAASFYASAHPVLAGEGDFLFQFGNAALKTGAYGDALKILGKSESKLNSYSVQLAKGECYRKLNQSLLAKKVYLEASYMVPSRLYPRYLLAIYCLELDQKKQAISIAEDILKIKVKIISPATEEMKNSMRIVIENRDLSPKEILNHLKINGR
ncbi:O-antigen ligase family protein [Pedobacter miscanthi]|uniref:O-antigen ligase-related domain-containing protein n=1 Tax=Pedobacter miscanthi TaxID=2259170 RepID=A0A366KLZ7_9SPHI|nr:O-antigen ligase family protein [Pedobacter miscanthi]RBQ02706.1 hypothetical protein DRW42_25515 [Pedobacter miscanthi]